MNPRKLLVVVVPFGAALAGGCYADPRAARDVSGVWVGRSRAEIESRWGRAENVAVDGAGAWLRWSYTRRHFRLPSGELRGSAESGFVAVLRPGAVWDSTIGVAARVDPGGRILEVQGSPLRWGAPNEENLRWGTILGLHVGMGRLDDTSTPLPSGGVYIGGMLGPTVGLVGCFSLVSGSDAAGGAMGFAWGLAVQGWLATRIALRGGPALVLALDPGFRSPVLGPGLTGGVSVAVVKVGTFVLDLRLDLTASLSAAFGSLGVGVNLN